MIKKFFKNIVVRSFLYFTLIFVSTVAVAAYSYTRSDLNLDQTGRDLPLSAVDSSAMAKLQKMSETLGKKLVINSSARKASEGIGSSTSQHNTGKAFDISLNPTDRSAYYNAAVAAGFSGFGFAASFIHVDIGAPRYWCYGGNSGKGTSCGSGTAKAIYEDYTGGTPPSGTVSEDAHDHDDDYYSGFSIDLKEGAERLKQETEKQLKEICGGRDYGLVGYDGGICVDKDGNHIVTGQKVDTGFTSLTNTLQSAINWVIGLAFMLAVAVLFYAGFLLLKGTPAQASQAKGILVNVIIGLMLIASAWLLVDWVFTLFGVGNEFKFTSVG